MEKARIDLSKMKSIIKKIDKTGEDIRNFEYGYHSLDMLIPGKDREKTRDFSISCAKGYKPTEKNAIRIDDGRYPVWAEYDDVMLRVVADADCIEIQEEDNLFSSFRNTRNGYFSNLDFSKCKRLNRAFRGGFQHIIMSNFLGTESVEDLSCMFVGCQNLESISIRPFFKAGNHIKNMREMFSRCYSLKEITGIEAFDMSNVEDMTSAFVGTQIEKLDASKWNIRNLMSAKGAFQNCRQLTSVNLDGWDVRHLRNTERMFSLDKKLKTVKINDWNLENIGNMRWMFEGCESITEIDFSSWKIGDKLQRIDGMFYSCGSVRNINLHGWEIANIVSMDNLFEDCKSLEELDISTFSTKKLRTMDSMFRNCQALRALDLAHFDVSACKSMISMFDGCKNLISLNLSGWKLRTDTIARQCFNGCENLVLVDMNIFDGLRM